jgi:hypothetical protein
MADIVVSLIREYGDAWDDQAAKKTSLWRFSFNQKIGRAAKSFRF